MAEIKAIVEFRHTGKMEMTFKSMRALGRCAATPDILTFEIISNDIPRGEINERIQRMDH